MLYLDIETAAHPRYATRAAYNAEGRSAPANYKDAEKIAAWHDRDYADWVGGLGLNPRTGRIVAIALHDGDTLSHIEVKSGEGEEAMIEWAFREIRVMDAPLVTFNGLSFDLPYLLTRAAVTGTPIGFDPKPLLRRYVTEQHVDLCAILSNWGRSEKGDTLEGWATSFGIPFEDRGHGKDVQGWVNAGNWDAIHAHVTQDVELTMRLYSRLRSVGWL